MSEQIPSVQHPPSILRRARRPRGLRALRVPFRVPSPLETTPKDPRFRCTRLRREAAAPSGHLTAVIAAFRVFDLDHLGALIGKRHRGQRARDHRRQVNYTIPVQRSWHLVRLHYDPCAGGADPAATLNRPAPRYKPRNAGAVRLLPGAAQRLAATASQSCDRSWPCCGCFDVQIRGLYLGGDRESSTPSGMKAQLRRELACKGEVAARRAAMICSQVFRQDPFIFI